MSSPQGEAALQAATTSRQLSQRAYDIALPGLRTEYGALNEALAQGGEPEYLKQAYAGARAGIAEGMGDEAIAALRGTRAQNKGAVVAGNLGAMTPQVMGSAFAKALYGPRVSEAVGGLEEVNKLLGASLGQSQQTGSAALAATGTQLRDIGMMRNYNQGYAGILAALNAGGSIYGAFGQRTDPYGAAIAPGGTSGSSNWQGFGNLGYT